MFKRVWLLTQQYYESRFWDYAELHPLQLQFSQKGAFSSELEHRNLFYVNCLKFFFFLEIELKVDRQEPGYVC